MFKLPEGFYKVQQTGRVCVTATFYNPNTKETIKKCVRDYDYADRIRDDDELYYMEINESIKAQWMHHRGIILVGDTVEVCDNRTIPICTIATVIDMKPYRDIYDSEQAIYLYLDNGKKINENNCKLVRSE